MRTFFNFEIENDTTKIINPSLEGYAVFKSVLVPTFSNFHSDYENVSLIVDTGVPATKTIENSFYKTGSGLASAIDTILKDYDANFTCSYDVYTQKITIENTVNFEISDSNLLNWNLGFSAGQVDGTTDSYEADFPINLFPSEILIESTIGTTQFLTPEGRYFQIAVPIHNFNIYDRILYENDKKSLEFGQRTNKQRFSNIKVCCWFRINDELKKINFGNQKLTFNYLFDY